MAAAVAAASGCQKDLGLRRDQGRGLDGAPGPWLSSGGRAGSQHRAAAGAGAAHRQANRLGEAEPQSLSFLVLCPVFEIPSFPCSPVSHTELLQLR